MPRRSGRITCFLFDVSYIDPENISAIWNERLSAILNLPSVHAAEMRLSRIQNSGPPFSAPDGRSLPKVNVQTKETRKLPPK